MGKFNTKKPVSKTVNLAGAKAYKLSSETELVHAVLTTFLNDKYYESGADRIARIQNLVSESKPQFVANLAVIARTEFNLRSVSHLLLGELSKVHNGDSLVKDAIVAATVRPDDLLEIASYVGKPMPKQVKRGLRNGVLKFDRYALAKYRGEGKGMSMVDLFNMTHPKVELASPEQKTAWKDLMEGNLVSFDTWETEISNAKNDAERTKIWERLILEDKIGYMALLRNINNLLKYNISAKAEKHALIRLTDAEEIARSKQLPFRFYTAYQNVKGSRVYSDAISEAMDIALENTPKLKGNTLIAIDTSGSMMGDPIDKAAIFAATLMKANVTADVVLYDTQLRELSQSGRAPVLDLARHIITNAHGGGTDTGLVFRYMLKKGINYDRVIILSDNESWVSAAQENYKLYKKATGNDPFVYAIDIEGYGTADLAGTKVFNLTGWSDRLLDFVGQAEKGETLTQYVRDFVLPVRTVIVIKNYAKNPTEKKAKKVASKKK